MFLVTFNTWAALAPMQTNKQTQWAALAPMQTNKQTNTQTNSLLFLTQSHSHSTWPHSTSNSQLHSLTPTMYWVDFGQWTKVANSLFVNLNYKIGISAHHPELCSTFRDLYAWKSNRRHLKLHELKWFLDFAIVSENMPTVALNFSSAFEIWDLNYQLCINPQKVLGHFGPPKWSKVAKWVWL